VNPDAELGFLVNPDLGTRSRILTINICAKSLSEKVKFLYQIQIAINLFLGIRERLSIVPKRTFNISEQKIRSLFSCLWLIFACLNPDPESQLNPDLIGIRSTAFNVEKISKLIFNSLGFVGANTCLFKIFFPAKLFLS
jgi:hypothetical protein